MEDTKHIYASWPCHADEAEQGRPWLSLPGWYGCAYAQGPDYTAHSHLFFGEVVEVDHCVWRAAILVCKGERKLGRVQNTLG